MATTFKFYTDSALTTEQSGNLVAAQNADGSSAPVDFVLYFGSATASRKAEANSNPGVAQIAVSISDAVPASGHATTEVKLALTQGGLDSATGGATLNLGTAVLSGSVNAVAVYIRVNDATHTVGTSTELSISTNTLRETVVV